jgi:hypothetical protein
MTPNAKAIGTPIKIREPNAKNEKKAISIPRD